MTSVDIKNTFELTDEEYLLADQMLALVDYCSRVLYSAAPGTHYMADKLASLTTIATSLGERCTRLSEAGIRIREERVRAALAATAHVYTLGRMLYPPGLIADQAVRAQVEAEMAANDAAFADFPPNP